MTAPAIRPATLADLPALVALHRAVAAVPGGLARRPDEVTPAYVEGFLTTALARGISLVVDDGGALLGELHTWRPAPADFAHVLGDLTVAVHPDAQGRGLGRALFAALLAAAETMTPRIERIELITRESNARGIRLYEGMGFRREGRHERRVRAAAGGFEADIPMAWLRDAAP